MIISRNERKVVNQRNYCLDGSLLEQKFFEAERLYSNWN